METRETKSLRENIKKKIIGRHSKLSQWREEKTNKDSMVKLEVVGVKVGVCKVLMRIFFLHLMEVS